MRFYVRIPRLVFPLVQAALCDLSSQCQRSFPPENVLRSQHAVSGLSLLSAEVHPYTPNTRLPRRFGSRLLGREGGGREARLYYLVGS